VLFILRFGDLNANCLSMQNYFFLTDLLPSKNGNYNLVKNYLQGLNEMNWNNLLRINPKDILYNKSLATIMICISSSDVLSTKA
jgi:hypothetical protein